MKISNEERKEAIKSITSSAKLDLSYLTINGIATIVACSGLMANSTAVIIGSMLIATLLSPIEGIALALTNSDKRGVFQGLATLLIGVMIVITIAFLYGLLFPNIKATDRMLARTAPGVFDFLIAFFGGIAGGFSSLFKRYSGVMVGVGIATALVPPLSTAGIFFAKTNYDLGVKALELALINVTFILFANYIVFRYFNLTYKKNE